MREVREEKKGKVMGQKDRKAVSSKQSASETAKNNSPLKEI